MSHADRDLRPVWLAAARGAVAAMAMSGMRQVTHSIGPLEKEPPDAIIEQEVPRIWSHFSHDQRATISELFHWTYGAAGGAVFGMLPAVVRRQPPSGALYGIAVWLGFELGLAPLLGVRHTYRHPVAGRVALAADHILYGIVVAGRLAPEPEVR